MNRERFRSDLILADRAFDESYWRLCPELASLVQSFGPSQSGQGRRRILQVLSAMSCFRAVNCISLEQIIEMKHEVAIVNW